MFERFTERARQVVVLAQDEARALKHNYIGTEHILLGLLREEEGLAARVLESLDITVEEVRAQVARIVGQGDEVMELVDEQDDVAALLDLLHDLLQA
ncbi:MAG: Clp protease N-terminal domain-containing protein, partial [Thermoanaerobaculia bacterium]